MNKGSEKQRDRDEKVVEIEIERLHDFKNHPFKVQADSQMKELQDSISQYRILNPLIVRSRPEGFYEVISGHRRKYAAMDLKYTKVPVIIRYMLDEEAKYERLKADEKRLDRMFDKTCYAKEIDELATKLADTFIRNLKNKDDLQKTAENAADSIKSYRADKKEGR